MSARYDANAGETLLFRVTGKRPKGNGPAVQRRTKRPAGPGSLVPQRKARDRSRRCRPQSTSHGAMEGAMSRFMRRYFECLF
jgi:hypothetical protein